MCSRLSYELREEVLLLHGEYGLGGINIKDFLLNHNDCRYWHLPPMETLQQDIRWRAADEIDRLMEERNDC